MTEFSKKDQIVALIARAEGATQAEICDAVGWSRINSSTMRKYVEDKLGLALFSTSEEDRGTVYRCGAEAEDDAAEQPDPVEAAQRVDTSGTLRLGDGESTVYAYALPSAPGFLKVGSAKNDTVTRIAQQISTGMPGRPILVLEIRTPKCCALERAIHGVLKLGNRKLEGGGDEWYRTDREHLVEIYQAISKLAQC